jgi:hypothetical protein
MNRRPATLSKRQIQLHRPKAFFYEYMDYLESSPRFCPHPQTVIIALAHQLSPLELGPVLEPICLIVLTLLVCLGGYEVLRCIPGLRMCFGITASRNPGLSSEEISSLPSTCRYGLIARE